MEDLVGAEVRGACVAVLAVAGCGACTAEAAAMGQTSRRVQPRALHRRSCGSCGRLLSITPPPASSHPLQSAAPAAPHPLPSSAPAGPRPLPLAVPQALPPWLHHRASLKYLSHFNKVLVLFTRLRRRRRRCGLWRRSLWIREREGSSRHWHQPWRRPVVAVVTTSSRGCGDGQRRHRVVVETTSSRGCGGDNDKDKRLRRR